MYKRQECEDLPVLKERKSKSGGPVFPGGTITLFESFLATLTFAQSEHLSVSGLGRLLKLISLHLPEGTDYFKSTHEFFKLVEDQNEPVQIHYYCSICLKNRASSSDLCDTCNDESRTVFFFISFPLVSQIAKLYRRPNFLYDIQYRDRRVKINQDAIEDIYDGELYQEALKTVLASPTNISLMWNTDGLQVYNSGTFSLWPFYLVVNELSPQKRFLTENMIIGGIWGSTKKPHPNVFLQPIHHDLSILKAGIDVKFYGSEEVHNVKATALGGTGDSPAIALFLNQKGHSGYFSCHKCYIKGEKSARTGNVLVFPYEEDVRLRNMEDYKNHVNFAVEAKALFNKDLLKDERTSGIRGPTLMAYIVSDIFASTAIDSMHTLYLGTMRQLLTLWFDDGYKDEKFSANSQAQELNNRIRNVSPPHYLGRDPQIIDKLVHWKANQLRGFLFDLSAFCLFGILKPEYYDNFLFFLEGVAILNSSSIKPEDVVRARMLLDKFVREFEVLYGLRHMSFNVHMIRHLDQCVTKLGNLFLVNCFKFEDMNGRLLNLVHGSRHAALQICANLSVITSLPLMIHNLDNGPAKDYCQTVQQKNLRLKINRKISERLLCVGTDVALSTDKMWVRDKLVESGIVIGPDTVIRQYHRLLKNQTLYVSSSYGRGSRTSSFVKYDLNGTVCYGNIEMFVMLKLCDCKDKACKECDESHVVVISRLNTSVAFRNDYIDVKHVLKCKPTNDVNIVNPACLQLVMFKVGIQGTFTVLSEPLNTFEME